jgi:hypothetical protein
MTRLASAVAAVCAIALVATGCGSDDSSGSADGNAGTPAASKSYGAFQLPGGNVYCQTYKPAYARCEIKKKAFKAPPKPANCPLDWGSALVVQGHAKGLFLCYGDTVYDPKAPTLQYGESSTVGGVTCISSEEGVACSNVNNGHGIFLGKKKYKLF